MAVSKLEYNCILISPNDVSEERESLTELIVSWNAHIGNSLGSRVELIKWESHSTPEYGKPAQSVLNDQLLEKCDLGVAIFWSKLGSPTNEYPSGSVEEIYKLVEKGKPIIIYFCSRPIPQEKLKDDQFAKLQEVKNKFEKEGLIAYYKDITELREQFQLHLTSQVSKLLARDKNYQNNPQVLTAPIPDVKIKVQNAVGYHPMSGYINFISVDIQNHSPIPVFIGSVTIKRKDDQILYIRDDAITGEYQKRRRLESGQSFSFNITYDRIVNEIDNLVNILVKDDIGRRYESDKEEFADVLKVLIREINRTKA